MAYKLKTILDVPVGRNTEVTKEMRFQFAVDMSARIQQDVETLENYYGGISLFFNSVVYVDEAGFNLQIGRRRGWARVGERATRTTENSRGGNLTVVAAISPAVGIVNWRASFGSMNTEKFVEFLEGMSANENV